jgi:hypothetical protein
MESVLELIRSKYLNKNVRCTMTNVNSLGNHKLLFEGFVDYIYYENDNHHLCFCIGKDSYYIKLQGYCLEII